ncbi:MarR family winged helix-turn-helix transcriptional regulator [Solilutibacter silvestris]|uniref:MarR-type transcriptional regulator n=1 Tax=Solilutibacter silvestris TaxID=1645665 RepID=A0A2K1Q288_9GAMM|nr:MarR family transcriptional regulator [Lysobacter silvestris]PNS09156.1 MarR-type transcriptional regulator [Lysobacter silvestris]
MSSPTHLAKAKSLPVAALLGAAREAFGAEFDARIKATNMSALSLAHAHNVLRHLGNGPLRASAIVSQCGVTKQAVSQQIAHLQRSGFVRALPDPDDQRARLIELTECGVAAQAMVKQLFADIEREWGERIGKEHMAILRDALATLGADHMPESCG